MLHNLVRITEENNLKMFFRLSSLGTWITYIRIDVPYRCLIDKDLTQGVIHRMSMTLGLFTDLRHGMW